MFVEFCDMICDKQMFNDIDICDLQHPIRMYLNDVSNKGETG